MRVIVDGAAGFIGSNLARRLLESGHDVLGIDNLSFGCLENIAGLDAFGGFVFLERDLRDPRSVADVAGDALVHLASQKIPRYTNALCTLEDNALMLRNVLARCRQTGMRLIYASTSDVYGKNAQLPYSEDSDLVLGRTDVKRWAYAVSKIHGEQLVIANHDAYGLDYTIVRPFGAYGPRQNRTWWGGPQAVFVSSALSDRPLEIHGDGLQTRTFTYVEDIVQGFEKCLLDARASNQIFNVAGKPDEEITILELAERIWRLVRGEDSAPQLAFLPYESFGRYEDVRRRVPDIGKIQRLLDYRPSYSLAEGLPLTIEWQRSISR